MKKKQTNKKRAFIDRTARVCQIIAHDKNKNTCFYRSQYTYLLRSVLSHMRKNMCLYRSQYTAQAHFQWQIRRKPEMIQYDRTMVAMLWLDAHALLYIGRSQIMVTSHRYIIIVVNQDFQFTLKKKMYLSKYNYNGIIFVNVSISTV